MGEQPTTENRLAADAIRCFACEHRIADPNPVARCPHCGWQERWGAD